MMLMKKLYTVFFTKDGKDFHVNGVAGKDKKEAMLKVYRRHKGNLQGLTAKEHV